MLALDSYSKEKEEYPKDEKLLQTKENNIRNERYARPLE